MQYVKVTQYLHMRLISDNKNIIKWNIDTYHAVYNTIIGHTGVTLQMVKGIIISKSVKNKSNTKSLQNQI